MCACCHISTPPYALTYGHRHWHSIEHEPRRWGGQLGLPHRGDSASPRPAVPSSPSAPLPKAGPTLHPSSRYLTKGHPCNDLGDGPPKPIYHRPPTGPRYTAATPTHTCMHTWHRGLAPPGVTCRALDTSVSSQSTSLAPTQHWETEIEDRRDGGSRGDSLLVPNPEDDHGMDHLVAVTTCDSRGRTTLSGEAQRRQQILPSGGYDEPPHGSSDRTAAPMTARTTHRGVAPVTKTGPDEPNTKQRPPSTFYVWRAEGLQKLLESADHLGSFLEIVRDQDPDVLLIQEVRLQAHPDKGRRFASATDATHLRQLNEQLPSYTFTASLASDCERGGQLVGVKIGSEIPALHFNFFGSYP
jgi:hypothetical protein